MPYYYSQSSSSYRSTSASQVESLGGNLIRPSNLEEEEQQQRYIINLDDSSDSDEIGEAVNTFKSATKKNITKLFKDQGKLETSEEKTSMKNKAKSFLLQSLGRIFFNYSIREKYKEKKEEYFGVKKYNSSKQKKLKKILTSDGFKQKNTKKEKKEYIKQQLEEQNIRRAELEEQDFLIKSLKDQLVTQKIINIHRARDIGNINCENSIGSKEVIFNDNTCVGYNNYVRNKIMTDTAYNYIIQNNINSNNDIDVANNILQLASNGMIDDNDRRISEKEKELSNFLYILLLNIEPTRSPAALINNIQILKMIKHGDMKFIDALGDKKEMPMARSPVVSTSAIMQNRYSEEGFIYPCNYSAYKSYIYSDLTTYSGTDYAIADLQSAEANILDKSLKFDIKQYIKEVEENVTNDTLNNATDYVFNELENKNNGSPKEIEEYIDCVVDSIDNCMGEFGLNASIVSKNGEEEPLLKKFVRKYFDLFKRLKQNKKDKKTEKPDKQNNTEDKKSKNESDVESSSDDKNTK